MPARNRTPADAGVLAAGLLADACGPYSETSLRLEVVRDLALDLGRRLEVLAREDFAADSLVEAALACADLATLAACNVPALPDGDRHLAAAATHLAAGTTRAIITLVEGEAGSLDGSYAENTLRDARSALWRADLAVKQIEA
jgi:ABC-type hemin transport system ATPase subunit